MCILANVGIGIFNRINFAVDAQGELFDLTLLLRASRGGMGTHDIVWDALSAWAGNPTTAKYFSDAIKIRGTSLRDILSTIFPGVAIQTVASDIVQNWGLDLSRGKTDHSERNVSSYAQHALNPINPPTSEVIDYILETWRILEPSSSSAFDALDRYLLRSLLQHHHKRITGNANYTSGFITTRYDQLPQSLTALVSREFLNGSTAEPDPKVVSYALSINSPSGAIDMLSRAILLLRAASGFTQTSFSDAGISTTAGHMRPWLDEWAEERGFWSPTTPLENPIDLWADIEVALIDLDESSQPPPNSLSDWIKRTLTGLPNNRRG